LLSDSDSYWIRKLKGIMTKDYEKAVSLLDNLIDMGAKMKNTH
jgi:hypothetical protein